MPRLLSKLLSFGPTPLMRRRLSGSPTAGGIFGFPGGGGAVSAATGRVRGRRAGAGVTTGFGCSVTTGAGAAGSGAGSGVGVGAGAASGSGAGGAVTGGAVTGGAATGGGATGSGTTGAAEVSALSSNPSSALKRLVSPSRPVAAHAQNAVATPMTKAIRKNSQFSEISAIITLNPYIHHFQSRLKPRYARCQPVPFKRF